MIKYEKGISVIIPVYNAEKYIAQTLESILVSDCSNVEIIIVDDGSSDHSIAIAEKILEQAGIFYKIIGSSNKGVSHARNLGIGSATKSYIMFLDADDCLVRGFLDTAISLIAITDISAIMGSFIRISSPNMESYWKRYICNLQGQNLNSADIAHSIILQENQIHVCGGIYYHPLINRNNIRFDEKTCYGEDQEFLYHFLFASTSVHFIKAPILLYRQSNSSAITKSTSKQLDYIDVVERIYSLAVRMKCDSKTRNLIKTCLIPRAVNYVCLNQLKKPELAYKCIKKIGAITIRRKILRVYRSRLSQMDKLLSYGLAFFPILSSVLVVLFFQIKRLLILPVKRL